MSFTIKHNENGVTLSKEFYDLTEELKQIFPMSYTQDTEASYQSRVEMVSDLVEYCAKLAIEKELS
jgi:hypothetical protein